jgi:hypothetical protein
LANHFCCTPDQAFKDLSQLHEGLNESLLLVGLKMIQLRTTGRIKEPSRLELREVLIQPEDRLKTATSPKLAMLDSQGMFDYQS